MTAHRRADMDEDDPSLDDLASHADPRASYTYVDLDGRTRGPFAASALVTWCLAGHLARDFRVASAVTRESLTVGDVVDACVARRDAVTRDDAPSALEDRLAALLRAGGGTLVAPEGPRLDAVEARMGKRGVDASGITLDASSIALEKYRRPRTWRDILRATRERTRRGRAAMRAPPGESEATFEGWTLEVNAALRDPRPDLSRLDAEPDEEGALPEARVALDLREPFWSVEDRARKDGALDAEALNAAVAEQLRNTSKPAQEADARSDRSDVSWSAKPGGYERQAAREAAAAAARNERAAALERAAAERAADVREETPDLDDRAPQLSALEEAKQREEAASRYFAANPYAGQWWLPDDTQGGEFSLGPFTYDDLVNRLPHVMVAHRREDDAWRVVGPYSARERFENYGRDVDGAVISLSRDGGENADAAEREIEIESWFGVATSIIDVDDDVKNPSPQNGVADERGVRAWFDAEMAKVKLPAGFAASKSSGTTQRKRRRGFEMRVVVDEQQRFVAARVLGELYRAVTKNRKRLFAAIVEPILDDWMSEEA